MSYEIMREDLQQARCACGGGTVERTYCYEMNDWNQTRESYGEWEIKCPICATRYHIESQSYYTGRPWWKGDSTITDYFLVPVGKTTNIHTKTKLPSTHNFKEYCVSTYPIETLLNVILDMKNNKFSTRLTLTESITIVRHYYHINKRKKLGPIISDLQECVENYNNYEWTFEKSQASKRAYEEECQEISKQIDEILNESHKLVF